MPTQTHIFDNYSNNYGHLKTAHVRSSTVAENLLREGLEDLTWVQTSELTSF
jgi:hypothetical protein